MKRHCRNANHHVVVCYDAADFLAEATHPACLKLPRFLITGVDSDGHEMLYLR